MQTDTLANIAGRLEAAPAGLHHLSEPGFGAAGLPACLSALISYFDGAELFHGSIVLFAAADIEVVDGRHHFGRVEADELYVDDKTRVWRLEADTGELLEEGSRLHRWLYGTIEGEMTMYDADGEFAEDVFGDDGRPTAQFLARKERKVLKRDKDALAPRWRLARALSQLDRLDEARDHLEQVVAAREGFAWAWYDLARISEALGELGNATEEMQAAATVDPACEYRGFFFAHCARLAAARDDEDTRRAYAAQALQIDPNLVRAHLDGACDRLDSDDPAAAKTLVDLALAVAPLDLSALDLRVQIETALQRTPN